MKIGIDIGGTTIGAGLADGGKLIRRTDGPSFPAGANLQDTLTQLYGRISELITPEVGGIGVGVPSVVDPEKGIVYDTQNIPSWKEVHLKEWLEDRFGLPTVVDNDANCYAMGSAARLSLDKGILACITLGTGVGCGIVSDSSLFRGRCCGAGELCCLPYMDGVIEDYTSSKFFSAMGTTAKDLSELASEGDTEAIEAFGRFGKHLAWLTCAVLYSYDPHVIVFGGGIAKAFPFFEKALRDEIELSFAYPGNLAELKICAITDADTALLGAASL